MRDKISFCKYDVIILEFRKGLLLCKKIKQKNLLMEVFCKKCKFLVVTKGHMYLNKPMTLVPTRY